MKNIFLKIGLGMLGLICTLFVFFLIYLKTVPGNEATIFFVAIATIFVFIPGFILGVVFLCIHFWKRAGLNPNPQKRMIQRVICILIALLFVGGYFWEFFTPSYFFPYLAATFENGAICNFAPSSNKFICLRVKAMLSKNPLDCSKNERMYCKNTLAPVLNNPDLCSEPGNDIPFLCYTNTALTMHDQSLCNRIDIDKFSDTCTFNGPNAEVLNSECRANHLQWNTKMQQACIGFVNNSYDQKIAYCKGLVIDFDKDNCVLAVAAESKNPEFCSNMTSQTMAAACRGLLKRL